MLRRVQGREHEDGRDSGRLRHKRQVRGLRNEVTVRAVDSFSENGQRRTRGSRGVTTSGSPEVRVTSDVSVGG